MDREKPVNQPPPIDALLVSPSPVTHRPAGLTAICVIVLVIGALGVLAAAGQSFNLLFGQRMQNVWKGIGSVGAPPEMRKAQDRMMNAAQQLNDRFFVANVIINILQWGLAGALIYGGIQALRIRKPGREVLYWSFLLGCLFEIGRAIPQVMIQLRMRPILEEYMRSMMPASNPQADAGARFGAAFAQVGLIMGLIFLVGWVLLKVVFYLVAVKYLAKPETRTLFESRKLSGGL